MKVFQDNFIFGDRAASQNRAQFFSTIVFLQKRLSGWHIPLWQRACNLSEVVTGCHKVVMIGAQRNWREKGTTSPAKGTLLPGILSRIEKKRWSFLMKKVTSSNEKGDLFSSNWSPFITTQPIQSATGILTRSGGYVIRRRWTDYLGTDMVGFIVDIFIKFSHGQR